VAERMIFLAQMILEKFNRISFFDPFNLNKAVNERDESPIEASVHCGQWHYYYIRDGLLFYYL
jgi:hypothetical protein